MHFSEGGYGRVAEKLFNNLDVDTYYVSHLNSTIHPDLTLGLQLEYDTERAGDFSPLKHLPPGKTAVLGLVTTKKPEVRASVSHHLVHHETLILQLETIEELKRRVEEAANAIAQGNPPRTYTEALNQ